MEPSDTADLQWKVNLSDRWRKGGPVLGPTCSDKWHPTQRVTAQTLLNVLEHYTDMIGAP
jgi:hypothetical protein